MFDFLDTRAMTDPTVVDMADVEEIEEEEVTAKEDIPESQEQEKLHFFPYLLDLINLKQEKYCLRMKIYKRKDITIIEKIIYL